MPLLGNKMTDEIVQEPINKLGYLCYSKPYPTEEEAVARFKQKHGTMPENIFYFLGNMYLGPVEKVQEKGSGNDE